ncbi:hypothetical protein HPB48_020465 [Haemaphysalis longicornis]|uniref:Uncharacterized protein n=1 Tax=Haemaphysalis longicornis TaxID=44386 RepID=A0A9J6FLN2_HAELO|nr:hypothetical protein HPB48_020465 [Haemaphysalis longicornis]
MGRALVVASALLCFLSTASSIKIDVADGGYEDILVSVSPDVPYNESLVENIKGALVVRTSFSSKLSHHVSRKHPGNFYLRIDQRNIDTEKSGSADSRSQLPSSHPVDPATVPTAKPRGARNRGLRGSFIDEEAKPVLREASKPYRHDAITAGSPGGPSRHPDDISLPINLPNSNEPACPTQAKDPRLVNPINQVADLMDT